MRARSWLAAGLGQARAGRRPPEPSESILKHVRQEKQYKGLDCRAFSSQRQGRRRAASGRLAALAVKREGSVVRETTEPNPAPTFAWNRRPAESLEHPHLPLGPPMLEGILRLAHLVGRSCPSG
jgi:hypothetical protein